METNEKPAPIRLLMLITTPKLSETAYKMFKQGAIPIQYQWNAVGTAPSEMIDILGLGSPDKSVLFTMLPKLLADKMLDKLRTELKLGAVNSGIAFTIPLSGANNLILRMLRQMNNGEVQPHEERGDATMADSKYTLIAAVFNQGYSEEVMDAAREAGAQGGTVVHSRRIGNNEVMGFWGLSIQEEREMLLIVAENQSKLKIMRAIGEKCGIHSEAKGIIVSLPIDTVIGLE